MPPVNSNRLWLCKQKGTEWEKGGLQGGLLFVSNSLSEMKKMAFPLQKWTMDPEGATELAPPWVKPSLGRWSAEATQLFLLKGRELLLPPTCLFTSPLLLSLWAYLFPLSLFFFAHQTLQLTTGRGRIPPDFLGWFSAILVKATQGMTHTVRRGQMQLEDIKKIFLQREIAGCQSLVKWFNIL